MHASHQSSSWNAGWGGAVVVWGGGKKEPRRECKRGGTPAPSPSPGLPPQGSLAPRSPTRAPTRAPIRPPPKAPTKGSHHSSHHGSHQGSHQGSHHGSYQDSHQGSFHHRALPPGPLPGLPPGPARWVKTPVLLRLRGAGKEKEGERKGERRGGGSAPFKPTKRLLPRIAGPAAHGPQAGPFPVRDNTTRPYQN
jgi:hypothetical protein